jgi:hypothetical protein
MSEKVPLAALFRNAEAWTRAEIEQLLFAIVGNEPFTAKFRALGKSTTRVSNSCCKRALIVG